MKTLQQIISFIKNLNIWWKIVISLWVVTLGVILVLLLIMNRYKKRVLEKREELVRDIQHIIHVKYGDIDQKKNGIDELRALPDKQHFLGDCWEEDYVTLPIEEKRELLKTYNIFFYCNNEVQKLFTYDLIMPNYYFGYANDTSFVRDFSQKEHNLSLLNVRYSLFSLCRTAEYYVEKGDIERGREYIDDGFRIKAMLSDDSAVDMFITIVGGSILSKSALRNGSLLGRKDLLDLKEKIIKQCILSPELYYQWYLFETLSVIDMYVSDYQQEFVSPGYKLYNWFLKNPFYVLGYVQMNRNLYKQFKQYIDRGEFLKGMRERSKIYSNIKKKGRLFNLLSVVRAQSEENIEGLLEVESQNLLTVISLANRVHKMDTGKFALSFNDLIDSDRFKCMKITKNTREMTFRGYRFGFIEKTVDGEEYASEENRKDCFGIYATPRDYALTGEDTFIVNEGGFLYEKDFGTSMKIKQWPKDPEKSGWEVWNGF